MAAQWLLVTAPPDKKGRKRKPEEEKTAHKKDLDKARAKTRVNIGVAFQRWRQLRDLRGLKSDADVALFLLDSYEKKSSISLTSTRACTCMQEPTAQSSVGVSPSERDKPHQQDDVEHQGLMDCLQDSFEESEVTIDEDECNSVENRLDMEDFLETTELSASGVDDSRDGDVYVPIISQSLTSTASELLLKCEEEELEPCQEQILHVQCKDEEDFQEQSIDQIAIKPEPSPLHSYAASSSPPPLETQTSQPAVVNNQVVAPPQLTSNTTCIGSLGTQCCAENSFTMVPAAQHQLSQTGITVKQEPDDDIHSSELHRISPVSLSSVQSPVVHASSSNQLQSDQFNSQTLVPPASPPCFTVLQPELTGNLKKQ